MMGQNTNLLSCNVTAPCSTIPTAEEEVWAGYSALTRPGA